MKRWLLLALFCLAPLRAHATWTQVQTPVFNNSCAASTSCAVTVTALGAGHLVVVLAHIGNANSLSSVTAAGETFTVVGPNCQGLNFSTETGCAYVLSSVGGATTVTCNWSATVSATNTTCGVYEYSSTAQSIFLDGQLNQNRAASITPVAANFSNNFTSFVTGTNDIEFQFINVASGTISAIDSSFTLDNHTGQVADAHLLNTIFNSSFPGAAGPANWTNSGSAAALVVGLAFGENFTTTPIIAQSPTGLQLSYDANGLDSSQELIITVPGLFRLGFSRDDSWGLSQWFDLVNDPNATTNLLQPANPSGGCDLHQTQPGMFNRTYYGLGNDSIQYARYQHYNWPRATASLNVLEATPSRVVIETNSIPSVTAANVLNVAQGTNRYYIYPNGQIYIHHVTTYSTAEMITAGQQFSDITFEDPTQMGTNPPDSQGWIRASASQNPYNNAGLEPYVFAYWGPSTPNPYTNYTKASIMLVRSPNTPQQTGEILHSWASCPGHGVVRWGFTTPATTGSYTTDTQDYLIQLGTQNSTVLPNLNSSTVAGPIANAYIANPTPPVPTTISTAVNQGSQAVFTSNLAASGTWSCAGTDSSGNAASCIGSINSSNGLYTAPTSVTAQQTQGGYQLLPNNHVFNTRIDSLPVNSNNTTWMNIVNVGGSPSFDTVGMPVNYITSAIPTLPMSFFYTPANNGGYRVNLFPKARLEGSYFQALGNRNSDHHFPQFNTDNGVLTEFYQYYAQAPVTGCTVNGSNVVVCTITVTNTSSGFASVANQGVSVQIGSFTGADTWANVNCPMTAATTTSITFTLTGAAGCATHGAASTTTKGQVTMNGAGGSCSVTGTCNSQSGLAYTYADYPLPANGATDAGGGFLQPLQMRLEEWNNAVANSGTINHAVRFDFGNYTCSCFIWPATANAQVGATVPLGARFRLKSSFAIGGYSVPAQILLKQMQQYGIIVMDQGNNWAALQAETTRWPANYIAAAADVTNPFITGHSFTVTNSVANGATATITVTSDDLVYSSNNINVTGLTNCPALNGQHPTTSVTGTTVVFNTAASCATHSDTGTIYSYLANYMEAVDESGLQLGTALSNCTSVALCGETTHNRETITYTPPSGPAVSADVALQGVAVNFAKDYLDIMVGTPAQQLTALVNIGTVTWSMNPAISGASLSSGGSFLVPASVASPQITTITATSTTNAAVSASMAVTVYPNPVRILPSQAGNYTDTFGNVWYGGYGFGTSQPVNSGCCSEDGSFPHSITNYLLWSGQVGASSVATPDTTVDMLVPNGTYQITYRYGNQNPTGYFSILAAQGIALPAQDFAVVAGGAHLPFSQVSTNVAVTDNHLRYTIYGAMGGNNNGGGPISSFSIIPGSVSSGVAGHLP